jgi:hypothetical protein
VQLATLGVVVASGGASCQRPLSVYPFGAQAAMPPQVLVAGASREQIVAAINQNSARIQSITATGVSITIKDTLGLPILSGNIAAERPRRFRLTAGTLAGHELDVGSNDELFWIWMRRGQPPAVHYCRHDQFANSSIRQIMPIEPAWLLSALGLVDIDPASVYDGPFVRPRDGRVEIRSYLQTATERLPRVLVIDADQALVLEQYVYDVSGKTVLAVAVAESHRYYPEQQVAVPERLSISLPTAGLSFKVDLGPVTINRLAGDPRQLWSMPAFEGYPQYDLSGAVPGTPLPGRPVPPQVYPLTTSPLVGAPAYNGLPSSPASPPQGTIYAPPPGYGPTQNVLSPDRRGL